MKRTEVDFSNHVHRVENFTSESGNSIRVDHFQVGDSMMNYIKFTNTNDCMVVTGDYGNWIFSRSFIPGVRNNVSDTYWIEKLRYCSEQNYSKYDSELTAKAIEDLIESGLEEYGYDGQDLLDAKEWFNELLNYTDDKIEYEYQAYRLYGKPSFIDYDQIPFEKTINIWLLIIFDAFDEICERLRSE